MLFQNIDDAVDATYSRIISSLKEGLREQPREWPDQLTEMADSSKKLDAAWNEVFPAYLISDPEKLSRVEESFRKEVDGEKVVTIRDDLNTVFEKILQGK